MTAIALHDPSNRQPSAEGPERSEAPTAQETEGPERSEAPTVKEGCELCEAARFTHWYFEDDTCWIADCEACLVPMVVWKPHGINPTAHDVAHMLDQLSAAGRTRFGDADFSIDRDMRTIPDHWHAHARDADWFRNRTARPLSRYNSVGGPRIER